MLFSCSFPDFPGYEDHGKWFALRHSRAEVIPAPACGRKGWCYHLCGCNLCRLMKKTVVKWSSGQCRRIGSFNGTSFWRVVSSQMTAWTYSGWIACHEFRKHWWICTCICMQVAHMTCNLWKSMRQFHRLLQSHLFLQSHDWLINHGTLGGRDTAILY